MVGTWIEKEQIDDVSFDDDGTVVVPAWMFGVAGEGDTEIVELDESLREMTLGQFPSADQLVGACSWSWLE